MGLLDKVFNNNDEKDYISKRTGKHIFISYSTKDKIIADAVCHVLEENNFKCWILPRNLSSGKSFDDEVSDAIKSAWLFLLVGSHNSFNSEYVINEISIAYENDKTIFPFVIDFGFISDGDRLELYFKGTCFFEAYPEPGEHFEELVKEVSKLYYMKDSGEGFVDDTFDVCIGYSTKDIMFAWQICYVLEQNNIKCWIAPRNVLAGENYPRQIVEAVNNSKIFVFIASQNSYNSIYAENDLKIAFNANKHVVSFKIDRNSPMGYSEYYLKNAHWIDAYPEPEEQFPNLIKDVYKLLNSDETPDTYYQIEESIGINTSEEHDDSSEDSITLKRPFDAYSGDKPYIFISYAHKDSDIIFREIKKFYDVGYPVWYDQGLNAGQEWDEEIEEALMACSLLVVFISENSMASNNVVDEIKLALEEKIDVVPIYLEDAELAGGLKLRLSQKHAIFKYKSYEDEYIEQCFKAFDSAGITRIGFEKTRNAEKSESNLPKSYEGNDDYIYASFSHDDLKSVSPDLIRFNEHGYNVCYGEWDTSEVLSNSSLMIVYLTEASVSSNNIMNEIKLALEKDIDIVLIYLEDVELTPGMELLLIDKKNIFRYGLNDERYLLECFETFDSALNESNPPQSYSGYDDYIYVSYSSWDYENVSYEIHHLQEMGYNISYDEGITLQNESADIIAGKILGCSVMVAFISNNFISSKNTLLEVMFAKRKNIKILPIYLEEFEQVNRVGLDKMGLVEIHGIIKTKMSKEEYDRKISETFKRFGFES